MLKVKDWIKSQKGAQFTPTQGYSTPNGFAISDAIRIIDGVEFTIITKNPIHIDYYFDIESGETVKIILGIIQFDSDNTHVALMGLSEILNMKDKMKSHSIKSRIEINKIEEHYSEVIANVKAAAIKKIRNSN